MDFGRATSSWRYSRWFRSWRSWSSRRPIGEPTEREIERNLVLSARLAADDVELRLEGVRQVLLTLSLEDEARPGSEPACRAQLRRLLTRQRTIVNIAVVRADGTIACGGRAEGLGSRLWLGRAVANRGFGLGEFERDQITGQAVIAAGLPVPGTARAGLRLVFALFDGSGTVLARSSSPKRFVGGQFGDRPLVRAALAEREGITTLEGLDGVRRLYAFSRVSAPGRDPLGRLRSEAFTRAGRAA